MSYAFVFYAIENHDNEGNRLSNFQIMNFISNKGYIHYCQLSNENAKLYPL